MNQTSSSITSIGHESCLEYCYATLDGLPQQSLKPLTSGIHYILFEWFDDIGHPRMRGYYRHPYHIVVIIGIYLWFVLSFGPKFMSSRPPFRLNLAMKAYNIVNIVANAFLCVSGFICLRGTLDCWWCRRPTDLSTWLTYSGEQLVMWAGEFYLALKIFELLDTFFFVLRKKWNQITPLHVIHHSIMPFTAYCGIKFGFSPMCGMVFVLNTFVHTVMYYYYHLSSLRKPGDPEIWWKRYITIIQLVQFYIALIHAVHILLLRNCDYPKLMAVVQASEAIYFIISFTNFYVKSYNKSGKVVSQTTEPRMAKGANHESVTNGTNNRLIPPTIIEEVVDENNNKENFQSNGHRKSS